MTAGSSSSIGVSGKWSVGSAQQLGEGMDARVVEVGRVGVDQVDALEAGRLIELVGDALEALGVGHEDLRPAVVEAVQDLVGLPPAVEPDQDRPQVDRGPEGQAPLGVVGRQDRDPVPMADPRVVGQRRSHAVGLPYEVAVGDPPVALDDELLVAPVGGGLGHLPQRAHAVLVDLHLDAVDDVGRDLERPSRPRQLLSDLAQRCHGRPLLPALCTQPPEVAGRCTRYETGAGDGHRAWPAWSDEPTRRSRGRPDRRRAVPPGERGSGPRRRAQPAQHRASGRQWRVAASFRLSARGTGGQRRSTT